jgi:hypothetical protein
MPARRQSPPAAGASEAGDASLTKAERGIVAALATYPVPLSREQLAFLADYHPRAKGFTNALGALRSRDIISTGFPATLTAAGQYLAGGLTLDVPGDIASTWLSRFGRAERAILEHLIECRPHAGDRDELASLAGYEHSRSKGFTNALGRLRGLGLVEGLALSPGFAALVDLR